MRGEIMSGSGYQYVYGPVPSQRLGHSLGVDIIPFKTCTYDCVYCQLGRTTNKTLERKEYVTIKEVLAEIERKLDSGVVLDYITLAGSGEPTLNTGIGELIDKIKSITNIPIAVLTNGSLLWLADVQAALMAADLVLPSLDAGDEQLFRYVNRPHRNISFEQMVDGLAAFTRRFSGEVWLEVFLLAGVTAIPAEAEKIASVVRQIKPARVQLNTVSRPPAEEFALPLSLSQMQTLVGIFEGNVDIIGKNENGGSYFSDITAARDRDILALLRRRPCTSEDVASGLGINKIEVIKDLNILVNAGKVTSVLTRGQTYYTIIGELREQAKKDKRA